jgi:hypothetical protein
VFASNACTSDFVHARSQIVSRVLARLNAGAFVVGAAGKARHVPAGFRGCADIWFQLKDGRLGVCEVKHQGAHPTADQQAFLDRVASNNGVAFVAAKVADRPVPDIHPRPQKRRSAAPSTEADTVAGQLQLQRLHAAANKSACFTRRSAEPSALAR